MLPCRRSTSRRTSLGNGPASRSRSECRARHRDLLRRDRGGRRRRDRRAGTPWRIRSNVVASQVEIHREWGGVVPGAGVAAARARHLRRRRARARPTAGADVGRRRCAGGDAGPGPGRLAARRRVVRQGARPGRSTSRSSPSITWPATSNRSGSSTAPIPLPAVVLVVSGGHTSLYLVPSARRVSAARPHARRCGGRGVRQGGQAAGARAIRAGRSSIGWRSDGNDDGDSLAGHAADQSRSQRARARRPVRFQLQRPQDGGAAPRAAATGRRSASSSCPQQEIVDLAASFQRARRRDADRRDVRGGALARRASRSASPAACRPIRACARTRCAKARAQRDPGLRPAPRAVDRQRRDDRRRRTAQARAGDIRAGRPQRGRIAAALDTNTKPRDTEHEILDRALRSVLRGSASRVEFIDRSP